MPRKKSIKKAAQEFGTKVDEIANFLATVGTGLTKDYVSWLHEYAIIRLYRDFESLVLEALVGAVNNDTSTISLRTGIKFPKHLTDEVCEYLLIGDGYFDFKGRDGLIAKIKRFVPETHYLVTTIKHNKYKSTLEQLSALRNFAAHESLVSKARVKEALNMQKVPSAGSWLKKQGRFPSLVQKLKELAQEIESTAPY